MIKAILFDLGDTVFDPDWRGMNDRMVEETGISIFMPKEIKKRYKEDVLNGKLPMRTIFELILKDVDSDKNVNEIIKLYKKNYDIFSPINKKMIDLIKILKNKYKIFALSNTNEIHKEVNMNRGLFKNFDETFLSFEMKLSKPNKKIFSVILERTKLKPEEIVFIDDNQENIKNASELGFVGIRYKNYDQLINRLKELCLD